MAKRRSLGKRVFQSPITHVILSCIMSLMMRAIYLTCRVSKQVPEEAEPYMRGEKGAIFCFWHGRMIMHPFVKPRGRTMDVLISHHNDGALITATMKWFGIGSVRGSKKLGSTKALRALLDVTERGGNIAITPDGPRGPFQVAAPGAAFVAAKTAHPILPVTFSASRHWRFRSWDKFMMPKPFARIVFVVGPMQFDVVDDEQSIEIATHELQRNLSAVTYEADRICGVEA